MKKRTYRAQKVNEINWEKLGEKAQDKELVLAIDVAKAEQYGALMDADREVLVTVKWHHPGQSPELIEGLKGLGCQSLSVAMESTGVYGDTLRRSLRQAGLEKVYQVSAKRVSGASEQYDGVPSMHDAKAAYLIGRLYWEGARSEWIESSDQQRELDALGKVYRLYQDQYQQHQNRAEALVHRHWPELAAQLEFDTVSFEEVLIGYGTPRVVMQQAEEFRACLRQVSRGKLADEKIEAIIEGARGSIGVPCVRAERAQLKVLGEELRQCREQMKVYARQLEEAVARDAELHWMAECIGGVTAALLLGERLDPRHYASSSAFRKALGLNLKERSSGRHQGQLKITKRGSGKARRLLFLAVLRLIYRDDWVRSWYERKLSARPGQPKGKTIVALMRKLASALWYVARGERFDARKLLAAG